MDTNNVPTRIQMITGLRKVVKDGGYYIGLKDAKDIIYTAIEQGSIKEAWSPKVGGLCWCGHSHLRVIAQVGEKSWVVKMEDGEFNFVVPNSHLTEHRPWL